MGRLLSLREFPMSIRATVNPFVGCIVIALAACADGSADQFSLRGGGRLQGELLNADSGDQSLLEIRTASGGTITLAAPQVVDSTVPTPIEREYEDRLADLVPTIEGLREIAEWCRENRLDEQRRTHLEQILELDRDHKEARAGLGYSTLNGRWIIHDQHQEQQGKVRVGSAWKLPQEVLLDQRADEFDKRVGEWKRQVGIWRGQLNRRRGAEALVELRSVNDPAAAAAYDDALQNEPNRDLRKLYISVLGKMTVNSVATTALARHALDDLDAQVRDAALDELARNKVSSAVTTFIRALSHDDNLLVNRAAVALSRMGDPRAIVPLIDALITEHKQVVAGGGGGPGQLGASFGGAGAGGLSVGSSPKVLKSQTKNPAVYQTLVVLTSANFGYDEAAWRRWYAAQNTPEFITLRRDE